MQTEHSGTRCVLPASSSNKGDQSQLNKHPGNQDVWDGEGGKAASSLRERSTQAGSGQGGCSVSRNQKRMVGPHEEVLFVPSATPMPGFRQLMRWFIAVHSHIAAPGTGAEHV